MLSYAAIIAVFALFLYGPVTQLLSGQAPAVRRSPRPQLNEALLALEPNGTEEPALDCAPDAYSVHIFSKEPLVLYIENFLTDEERSHLLEISTPLLEPSTVTHDGGDTAHRDAAVRDSSVAMPPRTGPVRCVEARARALQGWRAELWLERLRVQRYDAPAGHYAHHYDWSSGRGGWGRVSSVMAWVEAAPGSLEGGGTEFPFLRRPADPRWCRFVECPEGEGGGSDGHEGEAEGVVFKPVPGNAVFWENFRPDGTGRGYEETWHAGLPVLKGVKVGLNIWSWGRLD